MLTRGDYSERVFDCPFCGDLHPVRFDGYAGIDGDDVFVCPVEGKLELSTVSGGRLRELVVVEESKE